GEFGGGAGTATTVGDGLRPVGGRARHQMRPGKIGAQTLAGLELLRRNQRPPVAAASARQPSERAFGLVDGDADAAEVGRDLAFGECQMPRPQGIDRRALRLGWAAMRFFHARARPRGGVALDLPGEPCRATVACPICHRDSSCRTFTEIITLTKQPTWPSILATKDTGHDCNPTEPDLS